MVILYGMYSWQCDAKEKTAGTEKFKIVIRYNPTVS